MRVCSSQALSIPLAALGTLVPDDSAASIAPVSGPALAFNVLDCVEAMEGWRGLMGQ